MKKTFSFGKNWLRYVKYILNEDIIQNASNSLTKFISNSEFKNKIFIDIGCGSGLFSLCALRLGAKKVISFDMDLNSVQAANLCKQKFAPDSTNWDILQGSILDLNFLKNLELALKNEQIIVYSWGVLHHTDDLNSAMLNAANLAKLGGGGMAYIAIYNKTEASPFWLKIKKFYNSTNIIMKFLMVSAYTIFLTFEDIRKGRGLNMKDKSRGMHKITDVIDWLGGYPYEPATANEINDFWGKLGFECTKFAPTKYREPIYPKSFFYKYFVYLKQVGTGCNEFVFKSKNV